jgi:hypothetical protein
VPHISGDARPDPARFYTVRETLTGRTVGRVPKRGHIPLAEGDGPGSGRTDPVFSQDGRYVFVRVSHGVPAKNPNDPWTYVVDHARSRLWSVETGEPVPAPAELAGWRNVILGPDAAWAVWFDAAQDVEKTGTNSFPNRVGPAEVTCSRWDRATGKVTKLTAFKIGKGYGYPELTPDGGTLYWLAEARVSLKGGATSFPKVDAENPWFECWDVTGEEPKRRFQLRLPRAAGAGGGMGFVPGVQGSLAFSPSGAMAAYRTYGGEIVVYRMSDGEVHARFPLAGVPGDTFNGFRVVGRLYVSDDGERIVIRGENQMSVLERPGNRTTVRHVPVADLNDPQLGSITHGHLLADGKTYVQLDCPRDPRTNKARVRVWDVSRDPSRFEARALPPRVQAVSVQRDGNSFRRLAVADGRLFFEWPQAEASYDEEAKANGFAGELFGGPFVVRDPDGRELGTIPVKAERYTRPTAELLADGHRLLVHINVSGVGPKGTWAVNSTERWGLYDLDRGGREIAGGVGSLSRVPGAPYLIEHGSYAGAAGTGAVRFLILRHAATGDVFHRIEIPNRDVRFCEFDPTGKTYLVESVPRVERPAGPETAPAPRPVHSTAELALTGGAFAANPRPSRMPRVPPGGGWGVPGSKEGFGTVIGVPVPVRPVRIHLFDAATHRELLAWDVGPDRIRAAVSPARFSPDGKRILFRYVGGEPDMKAPPGMRPDGPARLWVARPDGRVEHDVALTGPLRVSSGGLGFGGRNPGVAESGKGVVCSPDGKHAALPVAGEIQIWDLDAGELRHTLTGHGGRGVDVLAAYSADGSRLFTVLFSWGSSAALTPAPIHVWDTATGRELLTLDTRRGDQTVPGAVGLEVVGGTLRLQGVRGVRTYDGTPVKP